MTRARAALAPLALVALTGAWAWTGAARAGGEPPLFEVPAAGSYQLPVIDRVEDHVLLAPDGSRSALLGLQPDQVALVSFVYRGCSDAAGCPAALATLQGVDAELARRPELARRVRLVTTSFDPAHDTPARMAELVTHLEPRADWRFLTAASQGELAPLLRDFGQDVTHLIDARGEPIGALRHVVKLYLVDARGGVRNVYSVGLLSVPLLLADVQTVLQETPSAAAR